MLRLAEFDLPVLLAALLIGLLTGRWMFGGLRAISSRIESSDDSEIAAIQDPGAVDPMQSDHRPL